QGTYSHGEMVGNFKQYWPDGTIRKDVNFVDDKVDGISKEYFENGNPEKELTYVDGILNGEMRYYHESGSISSIQYRKNNDYHGEFVWYYEDGEIELKQSYTNDYVIPGSRIEFNKDGSGEKVFYENWNWNYEDWESSGDNYSWEVNDDSNLLINQSISGLYKTKLIDFINTEKPYSYEVNFKKKSGKNEWGTGMYFNYKNDDNYTKFVVSSDGWYKVDQFILGISNEIQKWTKSSHINKYSGENKLKVIMLGEETIFSINGKIVLNTKKSMTDGNEFGVVADKGEYEITDFVLNQPFSIQESKDMAMEDSPNAQPGSLGGINWKSSGSGIVLSKSGLIATNYHVISDARHIEVELKYNGEIKSFKTRIVKTDEINDLAIIKIDDEKFTGFNDDIPYNFLSETKKTGTKIYALGYPSAILSDGSEGLMGKEIKFTDGRISAKTGIGGSPIYYQTTAPLQGGNSGGPLFDENANLVGINTMILTSDKFENVSYSVKSKFLLNLIEVIAEEFSLPNNYKTGRGSLEDQIEKISGFVALIKVK
ncbi:MAG: trypsin-like peptidase domain-containing protein, partial [Flavobacteriaceae bacterium]